MGRITVDVSDRVRRCQFCSDPIEKGKYAIRITQLTGRYISVNFHKECFLKEVRDAGLKT